MTITRRETLLATGGVLALTGCIDTSNGDETNPTTGTQTPDPTDDVFQLGPSLGQPLWRYGPETGFISLIESEDDRLWMVEHGEENDELESWLAEMDFDDSKLVYVETVGPNTCYSQIDVSDMAVANGTIVGTAEAVDTSDEDEGCGEAETHPSALVRVTGDELPSDAMFTVIDGRGNSSDVPADGLLVDPEFLPGGVVPPGDAAELDALECDDESFDRHWGPEDAARGESEDEDGTPTFAMRVHTGASFHGDDTADEEPPVFDRGDEMRVTMWNVADQMQYTGNRHKYSLQVQTSDGWQDVRGSTEGKPLEYTDEAIMHRPGEGFTWEFVMTEDGVIEEGHVHDDRLEVCPDLQPARYRFVFHEVGGEALSVEFDYQG